MLIDYFTKNIVTIGLFLIFLIAPIFGLFSFFTSLKEFGNWRVFLLNFIVIFYPLGIGIWVIAIPHFFVLTYGDSLLVPWSMSLGLGAALIFKQSKNINSSCLRKSSLFCILYILSSSLGILCLS